MTYVWRCERTNNPVGTDTIMIGAPPCPCRGCRGHDLSVLGYELVEALKRARPYVWQFAENAPSDDGGAEANADIEVIDAVLAKVKP